MLLFVDQHLQNGGMGTARKPLDQAAAGDWHDIGSLNQASTKAQNPAPCHGQWCGVTPGPSQCPYSPTCTYLCPVPPSSQQLELVLTVCFHRGTSQ